MRIPPFFVLALAMLAAPPLPAYQVAGVVLERDAPAEISLEGFCDHRPRCGFAPVRVTLRNDSDRTLDYTLSYGPAYRHERESRATGESMIRVAPGSRASAVVYAPVLPVRYGGSMSFKLSGPGVRSAELQLHSQSGYMSFGSGGPSHGHTGMGETFAAKHSGRIEAAVKKAASGGSVAFSVTKIGPAFIPADRRAYDGFDSLWFEESEWSAMEPAVREAVREWVALGGALHLVSPSGDAESAERLGFGEISRVVSGPDDEAFATRAAKRIGSIRPALRRMENGEQRLFSAFDPGETRRSMGLIIMLGLFALVIGPLNLFVFARPPHRHRLLWTTPLISSVAATILFVAILFLDGTGGVGRRFALVTLVPEMKRAVVWQQQISRTGMLFSREFPLEPGALLAPIKALSETRDGEYEKTHDGWAGDWFSGRAVQAQAILAASPTRGRIEFSPGAEPSVVSSLETTLADLIVVDGNGAAFVAHDLAPGVRRPLAPLSGGARAALAAWREGFEPGAGDTLVEESGRLPDAPYFLARAKPGGPWMRDTLASIRWSADTTLVRGPVTIIAK